MKSMRDLPPRPHRARRLLIGLPFIVAATLLVGSAGPATTQSSEEPTRGASSSGETFQESERITAIDLLVDVYPKIYEGVVDPVWDRLPGDLIPEDFVISDRGERRTPIAIATDIEEPWRIVVYVDQHLSPTASIRRAASLLASRAEELSELGPVEIVAGTPTIRQRLAPTEDAELIDSSLSNLAIQGSGDARIRALRAEFLELRADPELEIPLSDLAEAYASEEIRLIQNGFDDLLLHLLDVGRVTDRKALFLLTSGFDLDPFAFYAPEREPDARLSASYRDFLRAVASYGWVVVPIRSPLIYDYPDSIGPRKALLQKIDRNRNVKRAEALLDLARTQVAQKRWSEAEETLGRAIHRFYDHPKSRTRQAVAESLLAEVLAAQGEHDAAELARRRAVTLDPTLAEADPAATADLLDPEPALLEIAEASVGTLAREGAEIDALLKSLARRIRLTYQVPGAPDGALHSVSVDIERLGYGARSALWARSSTPEAVASARVRHRTRSFESQHDDDLEVSIAPSGDRILVTTEIPEIESELPVGPFRVSIALDGEEMLPVVVHEVVEATSTQHEVTLGAPAGAQWVTVLVEDLGTRERRQALTPLP